MATELDQRAALVQALAELPAGTKEATAWRDLCGDGKPFHGLTREAFRDCWLARVSDAARKAREEKAAAKTAADAPAGETAAETNGGKKARKK